MTDALNEFTGIDSHAILDCGTWCVPWGEGLFWRQPPLQIPSGRINEIDFKLVY